MRHRLCHPGYAELTSTFVFARSQRYRPLQIFGVQENWTASTLDRFKRSTIEMQIQKGFV